MPLLLYNYRGDHVATRENYGNVPLHRGDLIMARNPELRDELRLWKIVSVVQRLETDPTDPIITAWEKETPED
jgi:hypothetical protein